MSGTQTAPNLTITPVNMTTLLNEKYTLVMVDAWAPGHTDPRGQICHWVVNGVTVQGTDMLPIASGFCGLHIVCTDYSVLTHAGVEVEQYRGPTPPSGSGPHRLLLFSSLKGN